MKAHPFSQNGTSFSFFWVGALTLLLSTAPLPSELITPSVFEATLQKAQKGDAHCQNYIGACYEGGLASEQNFEKALEWYKKSAEQGKARLFSV